MYGTKDAAQCFDVLCEEVMQKLGYTVGAFNPCLYYHETEKTKVYRHGDDFALEGTRRQAKELERELSKHLLV